MFVKATCGCILLKLGKRFALVEACDADYDSLGSLTLTLDHQRGPLEPDKVEKLSKPQVDRIVQNLGSLIADGYRFRSLQSLLRKRTDP